MTSVVLDNVRVDFPIYGAERSLRSALLKRATGGVIQREGKHDERVVIRALSEISMALGEGDRLGLIGHNGSGKSTLLRVIAGIYEPVEGQVFVQGTVTPLFDMMPGLDPEDNGYENIVTAGLLFGLSRDEIEKKIPEVEEFSELGEYLSLPVRTYSTGMVMRLGFALTTSLDPGVLLLDEGIGTGDARFVDRAIERMRQFIGRSRIVVLASHSAPLLHSVCNKAALLHAGRLLEIGPVADIWSKYENIVHGVTKPLTSGPPSAEGDKSQPAEQVTEAPWHQASFIANPATKHELGGYGDEWAECIGASIEDMDGSLCERPHIHLPFKLSLQYRILKDSPYPMVPSFQIYNDDTGQQILITHPAHAGPTSAGNYQACCVVDPFVLNVGRYSVMALMSSYELKTPNHFVAPDALRFEVIELPGVDPRRHGWTQPLPAATRIRLHWDVMPTLPQAEIAMCCSEVGLSRAEAETP
jgi:ABC-type polysaccharide/polyol phosphate transport system ATPase subunit